MTVRCGGAVLPLLLLLLLWRPFGAVRAVQSFVRQPSDQYVKLGQTVVLPCQVSGQVGQVQWTRDEFGLGIVRDLPAYPRYQMIGDDQEGIFSLEIQQATLEDDAVFQCQVGSAAGHRGIRSRDARLTILVPPEPPRVLQGSQVTATAGLAVRLQCESRGGKPPAELEWYRADGSVIETNVTSQSTLISDGKRSTVRSTLLLTASAQHHNTGITCRAHNAALTAPQTAAVRLRVTFPPRVTVTAQAESVAEFEDVTMHCRVTANPAQVRYRWLLNGDVLAGQSASSVTLRAVGRHLNNATATCQVTNDVGVGSGAGRISVLYAPRFREEPTDLAVDTGQQATLTCAVDANPPPQVTWIRHDCRSCPQPVGVGRSLTLLASEDTVGVYECRAASGSHAPVDRRLRLWVRAAPRVAAEATQYGRAGQLVHLECRADSVPPPTDVTWLFNSRPVPLDAGRRAVVEEAVSGGVRSLLVIPDATEADFGLYNCSVTNTYGSDSVAIILEKRDDIPVLIILTVVIGAVIVITTIALVIIMCHRQQRRVKDIPSDPAALDKTGRPADANSSGSDLKVEIRTSSSGSGQVITDRWDTTHFPSHRTLYDQHSDERAFPPFEKMSHNGTDLHPLYDHSGYLQKSGAHQRMLHASTPIEFSLPPPDGGASPPHPYYPAAESSSPQLGYHPQEAGLPDRGPAPQTGPYGAALLTSSRPSYYAQEVSDGSSSSQTRLDGPSYEESAGSVATGRTRHYEPEEASFRPKESPGRSRSRTWNRSRSRSRSRHRDAYTDALQLQHSAESPAKPGLMATPV